MHTISRRSRTRLHVVPPVSSSTASVVNDLKTANRRMRHLAPWNVKPLPMMHSAAGKPIDRLTPAQRERTAQVARQVLAVHMRDATNRGGRH